MIQYTKPTGWIQYDGRELVDALTKAKSAVLSLQTIPYQKRWVEALQSIELKREVAGTSRIEGAEFTERELDTVMKEETPDELYTRSQRQARAALKTYEWIKTIPLDQPISSETILKIHRLIVTDADDDHCTPGELRRAEQNVTFGSPKHRGCTGGDECHDSFAAFMDAIQNEFPKHDPLIQAIAAHYHLAAMHPFLDGNGRTARALEALLLQRAGLRDTTFIAMSNYYHDEKTDYLKALADVRQRNHDLTAFLRFALRGVELQARRLLLAIQREIERELFRNLMNDLFGRLQSPRKRVIADRQIKILNILLSVDRLPTRQLVERIMPEYKGLKNGGKALVRDINALLDLGTISITPSSEANFEIKLDWPQKITETEFFEAIKKMPTARMRWLMQ